MHSQSAMMELPLPNLAPFILLNPVVIKKSVDVTRITCLTQFTDLNEAEDSTEDVFGVSKAVAVAVTVVLVGDPIPLSSEEVDDGRYLDRVRLRHGRCIGKY